MKLFAVFACLLVGCLAGKPHPCSSPPLMSGALTVSSQNEKVWAYAQYLYDALGQRLRLKEIGTYENKTFTYDVLLLYREATMYEIVKHNRTCKKKPLKGDFYPLGIPKTASLLGQAVVGSSSGPGEGLLVNTWTGDQPDKGGERACNVKVYSLSIGQCHFINTVVFISVPPGKFMITYTEFGCIPVSAAFHTEQFGWMVLSYFNNVVGISDPGELNPPDFCPDTEMENSKEEPADFLSLFFKKH
ncbi:ependymin-like 1 isoform X1 [Trachinotus anak]|uniref:ependymin-like 1 isoform X1 n=1 Tax=Trachinotus anak TaxID=443729 RepID=UPI0039F21AFD